MKTKRHFISALAMAAASLIAQPVWASWEAHLASKLTNASKCSGALYGLDSVQWAGQAQVKLPADEVKYIIAGFANPGSLFAAGPKVAGTKYMTTRADDHLIVLKHGTIGAVFVKSKQAVAACLFDESKMTPAQANIATQNFSDYLKGIGF